MKSRECLPPFTTPFHLFSFPPFTHTHSHTYLSLPPSLKYFPTSSNIYISRLYAIPFVSIIMNLNSSPSHFPMHQITHDASDHELYLHHPFLPNPAPSVSCHFFFDPAQHHSGFYDHHHHLYRPNHITDDQDYGGSTYDEIKNKVVDSSGLKFGLWKKEDVVDDDEHRQSKHNPMKWMSSKMRVMQKMKHTDHHDRAALKITSSADQKVQQPSSSSAETTDLSSNSSSHNNNNNSPIRVCSDCNTTKTPLWRSGPKGPKSLCNACGIRQRKARRAMAAAAAAAAAAATNGAAASTSDQSAVKIKLQHKEKLGKNGHRSQLKKRCKTAVAAATATTTTTVAGTRPSTGKKQLGFEEFLISLSKNLAFHHVFPDDEKDAAILLMALSSGLVNG